MTPTSRPTALQAVKGMNDILPPDSVRWEWFEAKVRALMARYGYANVRTPIVEPTALFVRGLGEVTDIVEKEMYSFEDTMNGEQLTLRPEATAGVVRAAIEHNAAVQRAAARLVRTSRCSGTSGRRRAAIGSSTRSTWRRWVIAGPDVDAELILMCRALWRDLGLVEGRDVRLELNSLGEPAEREQHRAALIAYLQRNEARSTRTRGAACTATRCASSTPRTRRCRRWSRRHPS